ncbi:3865_t:CDS:1 [Funneliformis geosporum]|nr:3865_t:CDS:1 [Funneliformis geosporum]
MKKSINLSFFVIPTGELFEYDQCQKMVTFIKADELVSVLQAQIRMYLTEKFMDVTFNLHAIDYEIKLYKDMKLEDKISDYFSEDPIFDHIHILVEFTMDGFKSKV